MTDALKLSGASGAVSQAGRGVRSLLPLPLLLGGLLVTLYVGLWVGLGVHPTQNDSYRYAMMIERFLGHSSAHARAVSIRWFCADGGIHHGAALQRCVAQWTAFGGLHPNTPQYNAIFTARPGYPLMAVPFVAVFGLGKGMAVLLTLTAIVDGWLMLVLARVCGLGQAGSLAAFVAFYLVPSFHWVEQYLTEAPTMGCILVVLIGTVVALRGRMVPGLVIAGVGYVVGFVVRYSTFSVQAAMIAACLVLLVLCSRRYRARSTYLLIGFNVVGFAVMTVLPSFFGWPGFSSSLQDTFSDHFYKPIPPDLDHLWLQLTRSFLHQMLTLWLHQPVTPILLLLGLAVLWYKYRVLAAMATAAALTSVLTTFAHPLFSQSARLLFQIYLLVAFGAAAAVDWLVRRYRRPVTEVVLPGRRRPPVAAAEQGQAADGDSNDVLAAPSKAV